MVLDQNQQDQWLYIWGSAIFSSKKGYLQLLGTLDASPWFKWLWNSWVRGKHKFFFWLLLRDKVNTRDMIRPKNMHLDDYTCVLCHSNQDETMMHLFFQCPFSQWCWRFLNIDWNTQATANDMLLQARLQFGSKIFREVFMVVVWFIWCHRNKVIFDQQRPSFSHWKVFFKEELALVMLKVKPSVRDLLESWLCNSHL